MNIYVAIACLLASVSADGPLAPVGLGGLVYAPGHASPDYYSFPRYAFEYSVKDPHTGDNKAQWEKREGDVVKGAYSLVEPDGSLRVVEYYADDKSGFNAVVKRIGPNLHPTTVHAAPIYKAPIPVLSHGPVVGPISIGPVAKLGHLADAPLISGPVHGAISSQSFIKDSVPVIKPLIPAAPVHLPAAPIHHEPISILPEPLVHHQAPVPIFPPAPIHREPIPVQPPPLIKGPIFTGPIYRAGPIYSKPLGPPPYYKAPLPIYKEPLLKAPVGFGPVENLGGINYGPIEHGPIGHGPIGPIGPWGGFERGVVPVGPLGPLYGLDRIPFGPVPGYDIIEKEPQPHVYEGPLDYSFSYKH